MCALVAEVVEPEAEAAATGQRRSDRERRTELGHVAGVRSLLHVEGLPDGPHGRGCDADLDGFDIVGRHSIGAQLECRVDRGVREVVRGVRLEEDAGNRPIRAKPVGDLVGVERAVQPGPEEPESALEHGGRARDAEGDELRGGDARVGRPTAVHALHGSAGAVGLDDAGGHGGGYPEHVDELLLAQPEQHPCGDGGAERTADGGGVLAVFEECGIAGRSVEARHADPHAHLDADSDRRDRRTSIGTDRLRGSERRGNDGGARVQHRRQVGVVVVERVREHAVDKGGLRSGQLPFDPDAVSVGHATLGFNPGCGRLAGLQLGCGETDSEDVEDPAAHAVDHVDGQRVVRTRGGESGELLG